MIIDWKDFRETALSLTKEGYVPVFGEFCQELEEVIVECILQAKKQGVNTLTLLIRSNGGANHCFTGIRAAMSISNIKFTGIVMSSARSNGFRLLQHCHIRKAVENAMVLFHWGGYCLNNNELAALIAGETWPVEHVIDERLAMLDEVSKRTGIKKKALKQYALQDRSFTAREALALNMIDEIIKDVPIKVKEKQK